MPNTRSEGRMVLIDQITRELGAFQVSVQTAIKNNLPSYNVVAETVLAGLLNHIHGWKLINVNAITRNSAGVDLIDPANRISVQVTSTNTLQKLDHTLEQFESKKLNADYDRLIHLIITTGNPTATMKQRTRPSWFSGADDLWNIPELLAQIQTLDIGKLETIADYLNREVAAFGQYVSESHLYLPPLTALGDDFVGREAELQNIASQIFSRKPVYLSGLGGMGKTELAVRFAREYSGGTVYFAHYSESFTKTITAMFSGVYPRLPDNQSQPSEAEQYNTVISLLEKCGERDILIIDNLDASQTEWNELMRDPAYKKLCSMKLRLLITTRFEHDRAIPIIRMEDETLFEIFRKHGADLTEAEMIDLIDEVNGHTMTIDLIARTLNGKGWRKVTAEMMLTALREHTLPNENYRKIATDYNQSEEQAQIYQHLSTVFDVTGMTKICENVMRYATLLPENGMFGELFGTSLKAEEQAALDSLLEHGWLEMKDDLLMIHPVIRLVCRTELTPTAENCGDFLNILEAQYDPMAYDRVVYAQLAETFALAANYLEDQDAEWINISSCLFCDLAQYEIARKHLEKHLTRLEDQLQGQLSLAKVYNNLGTIYGELGQHQKALNFKQKNHKILEQTNPQNIHLLVSSYDNIGYTYGELGKHKTAFEYHMKALTLCEEKLPDNWARLSLCYNNVGLAYGYIGDHQQALKYQQKALAIRENHFPPNHPDIANSYNNIAGCYYNLGMPQKSLDFLLKALPILDEHLSEDHPNLATVYNNIAGIYSRLGHHQDSLEFHKIALRICKNAFREPHPTLALYHHNLGFEYFIIGNEHEALSYLKEALRIFQKAFPDGHQDIDNLKDDIQLCEHAILIKENMSKTGFDFSKPLPPLPFIK